MISRLLFYKVSPSVTGRCGSAYQYVNYFVIHLGVPSIAGVFRTLRRTAKGSAFGNRELLKKSDQNFYYELHAFSEYAKPQDYSIA